MDELFSVVEMAEPLLLLCKDTIEKFGTAPEQSKAIEKELARLHEIKAEWLCNGQ